VQEVKKHSTLDQCIIRTLIYFDIFNYPLKAGEVFRFLERNHVTEKDIAESLNSMADDTLLFRFGEFYSLQPDESIVMRRMKGNNQAEKMLPKAKKMAMRIAGFPFVRAVMASGSLSKEYMDEKSDFDFFIVTQSKRVWICRFILASYKRIFLRNSHKFFCANYFIDTQHLEIEEKNLFTATELATLIPLYGQEYYKELHRINRDWLLEYFPNFRLRETTGISSSEKSLAKKITEKIMDIALGNVLEKFVMFLALRRWSRLYEKKYSATDFKVAFKTKEYVSKNHPRNFQRKVMELYKERVEIFSKKFGFQ
jgi:hypothetical protein